MAWGIDDIPDQSGRTAIVTGANTGIGFETARVLAHRGADVTLACRDEEKGRVAVAQIAAEQPRGRATLALLDLARLDAVRAFAQRFTATHERLDLLINNAGVAVPPLTKTAEGFELQFGVNFLAHYALTGLLFERLDQTAGARVVSLGSEAARLGRIDFDSFHGESGYKPWRAYQQSKLACLMFALELQRRLDSAGSTLLSVAAHPGVAKTELMRHTSLIDLGMKLVGNTTLQGALPTLHAATAPQIQGGAYIGPSRFFGMRGGPAPAEIVTAARDQGVAKQLWQIAEQATGVRLPP